MINNINDLLSKTQHDFEKYKFISENFPDADVFYQNDKTDNFYGFRSKLVNNICNNYDFESSYCDLHIVPFYEADFEYNNCIEKIKIYSKPRRIRLLYRADNGEIKFSKFRLSFSKNNINEQLLNDCALNILDFIKRHKHIKLNMDNIDPRIKKLLVFS